MARRKKNEPGRGGCLVILIGIIGFLAYDSATTTPEERIERQRQRIAREKDAEQEKQRQEAAERAGEQKRKAYAEQLHRESVARYAERDRIQAIWDSRRTHWLNMLGDEIRHNSRCQFFNNTDIGRFCGPSEGQPCENCGG